MASGTNLSSVASRVPTRTTGADLYALCADAWMRALKRGVARGTVSDATGVEVAAEDFDTALASLRPSVSESELKRYAVIRERFAAR